MWIIRNNDVVFNNLSQLKSLVANVKKYKVKIRLDSVSGPNRFSLFSFASSNYENLRKFMVKFGLDNQDFETFVRKTKKFKSTPINTIITKISYNEGFV